MDGLRLLRWANRVGWPAKIRDWGWAVRDLVLPPRCVGCGRAESFAAGPEVCRHCRETWTRSPHEACGRCGGRVHSHPVLVGCKLCHNQSFRFVRAVALGNYEGELRDVVYRLKRRHQEPLAYQVGRCLGEVVQSAVPAPGWDLVVPLPTHWRRAWQRGGNPAERIAAGVARELRRPLVADLLEYVRPTRKQGQLSRPQRLENVHRAVRVRTYYRLRGLQLLVVDDVLASGATANEAARALVQAGAAAVGVAVVARGTSQPA